MDHQRGGDTSFSMKMIPSVCRIIVHVMHYDLCIKMPPIIVFAMSNQTRSIKIPVVIHLRKWNWVKKVTRVETE
ncbi:MAG: hypothetical protein ACLUU0_09050 [Anaerostipes hadrus]